MGHARVKAAAKPTPENQSQKQVFYYTDKNRVQKASQQDFDELARLLLRVYKKKKITIS